MLSLKPEDEKSLHPEALKWFNARRAEIQFEVPLEELSDDDLNTFLSDDEKREFTRCKDEIAKGLSACISTDDASPDPLTNASIGLSLLTFEVNSLSPMYTIRLLLKKVYQRKVAKAKQEQRKQEEEERQQTEKAKEEQRRREEAAEAERRQKEEDERWWDAYKALNIPANDAFKYLKPEEHEQFTDSIFGAVDAYLAKRESYILDSRADDYLLWINVINKRREEEERKNTAAVEAREFGDSLNEQIKKLEASLYVKKQSPTKYFAKDRRYIGQRFYALLSPDEKEDLFDMVQEMVKGEID